MKIAIIIPIYKNGKHEDTNNYGLIAKSFIIANYSTVHENIHNYNFVKYSFHKNNKMAYRIV